MPLGKCKVTHITNMLIYVTYWQLRVFSLNFSNLSWVIRLNTCHTQPFSFHQGYFSFLMIEIFNTPIMMHEKWHSSWATDLTSFDMLICLSHHRYHQYWKSLRRWFKGAVMVKCETPWRLRPMFENPRATLENCKHTIPHHYRCFSQIITRYY